jgi:mono/diheme cytochrome c family protein
MMMNTQQALASWFGWLKVAGLTVCLLIPMACQQRMAAQPSYKPLDPSSFFPDGRSARPLVPNTVARGHLRADLHLYTGLRSPQLPAAPAPADQKAGPAPETRKAAGAKEMPAAEEKDYVDTFPFPITHDVLQRGQNRYVIYCAVCHDPVGTGRGKIVERGYTQPPSYHIDRLRKAPVGHFFDVITNGYGSMPDYKEQVPPRDRWAIVAYIRALQMSQHFPVKELPPDMRAQWEKSQAATAGGPPR